MDSQNQKQPKFKVVDESNRFLYALCPVHRDTKPSLCINRVPNKGKPRGYFYCFGCGYFGEIPAEEVDRLSKNIVPIQNVAEKPVIDFAVRHREYFLREFRDGCGVYLAEKWDVSPAVITELGIGWDGHAHTIPMYDLDKIIGIQRQFTAGYKCMVSGSNLGLIIPMTCAIGAVQFITEGASDLACLLDMGYHGIARPNALVGKELVYNWLKRFNPVYDLLVIVTDNNEAGHKGSTELADYLDSERTRTKIVIPGSYKDIRLMTQERGKEYVKDYLEKVIK